MPYPGADRYRFENQAVDGPWQGPGGFDPTLQAPVKRVEYR